MASSEVYPPPESRGRAVLVQNITHVATGSAIDDFFSFCGTIESKKIRTEPPTTPNGHPTLEAVVIFADEGARRTALMMNDSIIVDQPVTISAIPDGYDFNDASARDRAASSSPFGAPAGLFGSIGGLFADVSSAVATECKKAAQMLDNATETGVLKTAKDQVAAAQQKTRDFAADIDDKYHVKNTILNVAENSKAQATAVASVVAEQTRNVASQVDGTLHISEKTGMLAEKAMENETVNYGYRTITNGFQSLLAQTGLQQEEPSAPSNGTAPQQPPPTSNAPVS